jgi:RNA polymerase sigma-70 factor (ECF subfamily)
MNDALAVERVDVETWYRGYGPMVLRRCRQLLKSESLAADAMQETFVNVLRHRTSLRTHYPSSLLYRIATNVCLNVLRANRRRPSVSADAMLNDIPGQGRMEDRILDSLMLEQVFAESRKGDRRIAEMHYLEDCTLAETAQQVELSISGVVKRLHKLHKQSVALMAS